MNNEFIEITEKEITPNKVYFISNSTTYTNEIKHIAPDIKQLLKRCQVVCKSLKSYNVVISNKYGTRKLLKDSISSYNKEVLEYNHNFDMLCNMALWITSKPLPVGTIDNEELNEMYVFRNKVIAATYRNTLLDKVLEFENKIIELEQAIKDDDISYSKITF